MYEQSHRDYLRSGYLHHHYAVAGLLIITVMPPLPTSPARQRTPKASWRTRQLPTTALQVVSDVAALVAKYTKRS